MIFVKLHMSIDDRPFFTQMKISLNFEKTNKKFYFGDEPIVIIQFLTDHTVLRINENMI